MTEKITCTYCGIIGVLEERKCLGCGAPFSLPVKDEHKENDAPHDNFVAQIKKICTTYEENESCHTRATIPKKKLRNATEAFSIKEDDQVIFIYDGTVFGNNKLGFAICRDGLYWKNDWATPTKRNYLSWDDYKERKIKTNKKDFHISLGRGDKVAIVDEDDIKELGKLLGEIKALL